MRFASNFTTQFQVTMASREILFEVGIKTRCFFSEVFYLIFHLHQCWSCIMEYCIGFLVHIPIVHFVLILWVPERAFIDSCYACSCYRIPSNGKQNQVRPGVPLCFLGFD